MRVLIRFFWIVPPWHRVVVAVMGGVVLVGAAAVAGGLSPGLDLLGPLLVLQALAASSGFAGPARRGHYDFLLAGGYGRFRIGVVHWLASIAPGVAAWLVLVIAECLHRPGALPTLLTFRVAVAVFAVSALPWAATVALPRLTGGIVGTVMLVTVVSMMPPAGLWLLLSGGVPPAVLIGIASVAAAAVGRALVWIRHADVPLETAQ